MTAYERLFLSKEQDQVGLTVNDPSVLPLLKCPTASLIDRGMSFTIYQPAFRALTVYVAVITDESSLGVIEISFKLGEKPFAPSTTISPAVIVEASTSVSS